jgi:excisionase family DNA binding protein
MHVHIEDRLDQMHDMLGQVLQYVKEMQMPVVPAANKEKPITTRELCEFLGISEPSLIRMRKKGLPWFSPGGTSVRFYLSAVTKFLDKKPK